MLVLQNDVCVAGCDGVGHITGLYAMHFALSGCPIAHGKTPEECKSRRIALNRLRQKSLPDSAAAEMQDTPPKPVRKTPRSSQASSTIAAAASEAILEKLVWKSFTYYSGTSLIGIKHYGEVVLFQS